MKTKIRLLICFMFLVANAPAQTIEPVLEQKNLDYSIFIGRVLKHNVSYAAEKYNLSIAEANIISSDIIADPEFTAGAFDNNERTKQLGRGYTVGMSWTAELGAKRQARRQVAKDEMEIARLLLIDYLHHLRVDATLAFLAALKNHRLVTTYHNSYQQLRRLAKSDSLRYQMGAIRLIDYRQSTLQAAHMWNTYLAAEAAAQSSFIALSLLMGESSSTQWIPEGSYSALDRDFILGPLLNAALCKRADLKSIVQGKQLSHSLLKLARANRALDLNISLSFTYNGESRNETAPTPQYTAVNASLTIPLKFSNVNKGAIKSAKYKIEKNELMQKAAELNVQTQVKQAFAKYKLTQKQVHHFDTIVLGEAEALLEEKIYAYNIGETSQMEVIHARLSYNESILAYEEACYNYAVAKVELQRAASIWDLDNLY